MTPLIPRRLLLVEDEPLVAALLGEALTAGGFDVTVAHGAQEAKKFARTFDPDIAVIDINLGGGATGVDVAYVLDKKFPGIAIVFLTKHPDLRTAGFTQADVPVGSGFVRKDLVTDSKAVTQAIEAVISPRDRQISTQQDSHSLAPLTKSQLNTLRMVAQGFTNQEIAHRRSTSVRAVEMMLSSIADTLGIPRNSALNPRVEMARQFIQVAGTPDR